MNDCSGRILTLGDKVVTNVDGYTSDLVVCVVMGFTPKKVKLYRIEGGCKQTITKFPAQVCRTMEELTKEN